MLGLLFGLLLGRFLPGECAGFIGIGDLPTTVTVFEETSGNDFLYSVRYYQSPSLSSVSCSFDPAQPKFSITAAAGADQYLVQVISSPSFDHSATNEYVHVIKCIEGSVLASATVTVSLIPNVAPTFTNDHSTVDLSAKTIKAGMNIFTLSYTDPDTPSPLPNQALGTVTPAMPETDFFTFSNDMLKINYNLIDYDDEAQYVVLIEAADEKSATSTLTLTVNINDRNTPPEFVDGVNPDKSLSLPEFTSGRLLVYDIDTFDAEGDFVKMTEVTSNGAFELVPATGEIYLLGSQTLDFEATPSYVIRVTINDYIDAQTTSTFTLTVSVNDIPEQPTFTGTPSPVTIEENVAGTVVGTPDQLCTDPDGIPPDTIAYAILFSTESPYFSIDATTAEVSLALDYDYDDVNLANEVNLTIRCSDSVGLSDDTIYSITITDVNDNNPVCNPSVTSFSLTYAQTVNTTLVNVDCSDIDSTVNAELDYNVIGFSTGYGKTYFQVDSTGNVSISTEFTMDFNTSFYVTILITDNGVNPGALSATVTLTVTYTERPTITTYEGVSECFLCTTSALTLISVAGLMVIMSLIVCIVLCVLKRVFDHERNKMLVSISKPKKKSSWRWCGCLRPGQLKKKKKTKREIMLAERRDQEYLRARNELIGLGDGPSNADTSFSQDKRSRVDGVETPAYMERDMTPDISGSHVNKKGLTKSQREQLETFKEMKMNVNKPGPSTSKKSQGSSGMIWSFGGK